MTDVVLLTKDDCGLCEHAKRVLAGVAAETPLRVREMSIDSAEGRRIAADAGFAFPPGVLLDGAPFSYGRLSERKLRRALQRRGAR